jgi:hypothetical protein
MNFENGESCESPLILNRRSWSVSMHGGKIVDAVIKAIGLAPADAGL